MSPPPPPPSHLSQVDDEWISRLMRHLVGREGDEVDKVVKLEIVKGGGGGALSQCCKVFVHLERRESRKPLVSNLFVKVAAVSPDGNGDKNNLMTSNLVRDLFRREIAFYRDVLPRLRSRGRRRLRHFSTPAFVFGDVDDDADVGGAVVVLEDVSARGFRTFDPTDLALLDLAHMRAAVLALAEFHGLCLAHDAAEDLSLVQRFPILEAERLVWYQKDTIEFLAALVRTGAAFLDTIPGEQDTARRYLARLSDPAKLFAEVGSGRRSRLGGVMQHGDSWHNNFMFNRSRADKIKTSVVDWQVCFGHGLSPAFDLSFLLYSSSTSLFRRLHAEDLAREYLEVTREAAGLTEDELTWEELQDELKRCLPLTLLFCGSIEDLKADVDDDGLELATDAQIRALDLRQDCAGGKGIGSPPPSARALRRRNYLDICREGIKTGAI